MLLFTIVLMSLKWWKDFFFCSGGDYFLHKSYEVQCRRLSAFGFGFQAWSGAASLAHWPIKITKGWDLQYQHGQTWQRRTWSWPSLIIQLFTIEHWRVSTSNIWNRVLGVCVFFFCYLGATSVWGKSSRSENEVVGTAGAKNHYMKHKSHILGACCTLKSIR